MTARIYVGTYAKYNAGSINGSWLDLEDYSDKDAFLEACKELHKDEDDPEFMFQDYEGFPREFYNEGYIKDDLFAWLELDEHDRELLAVYVENIDSSGDIDAARDAFYGKYNSKEDWASEYIESCGLLHDVPDALKNYFDYAAYARDAELDGMTFVRQDGEVWVFHNG